MSGCVILACGAIARELRVVIDANRWSRVRLICLPAHLHNRPERIPDAVADVLERASEKGERVFVAYADCGTGGRLDAVLQRYGVERLPGAHCYDVFAGDAVISALSQEEPGTFFLTDFLVRHFDRLVLHDLGISQHPEWASLYFGHYRRLVYLSQKKDTALLEKARQCASKLGLAFEHRPTGYERLSQPLIRFVENDPDMAPG